MAVQLSWKNRPAKRPVNASEVIGCPQLNAGLPFPFWSDD
jgi:hypothetical protein